ncbi:MAG: hypothetical protein HYT16_03595 [DPANN group archaeon]|nr:hypothetical protein [DPANN group archaeon]
MKVNVFSEVKILEQVRPGVYKAKKLADSTVLKSKEVIKQASSVILAARACDGMFYRVNSDLAEALSKNTNLLRKGYVSAIPEEALPLNGIHGSRFVIFHPKSATDQAFLLGDVQTALRRLGRC